MAIAIIFVFGICATACNDISTVEVKMQIYNVTDSEMYDTDDVTMSIDLYGHLAPNTVDAVKKYIAEGYYDGALVYQKATSDTYQYMFGDLKLNANGKIVPNAVKKEIKGEFYSNGVKNGEIKPNEGAIGLWRTKFESDTSFKTSSDARNTARAEIFAPTSSNSTFDGYFCMFAKFDTTNEKNSKVVSGLDSIFENVNNYELYEIYYTGTYNTQDADNNYGLTFNIVKASDFEEDQIQDLFEAKGNQLEKYNHYTVKVANIVNYNGVYMSNAMIKSAKVK